MGRDGNVILKKLFKSAIWIWLLIVLSGCYSPQEIGEGVIRHPISVPEGYYDSVLRFPNGDIFIQAGRLGRYEADALHYFSLSEEKFVDILFVDDSRCRLTRYGFPTVLPDGRLGLIKSCHGFWQDRPPGLDSARFIVAYDWTTGEMEQIVDEPLPFESVNFTWNPNLTRGIQGIGSLLGTLQWITPNGTEPMTITVGSGAQSWALDENLAVMNDYDFGIDRTDEVGIARRPAWSPNGDFIAFWASTNLIGRTGMARARGSYALYLLDPETLELQTILNNVRNDDDIVWSPDNKWLLFEGDIGSTRDGLWLLSINGGEAQLVAKGSNFDLYRGFNGYNWLNDREIIATICLDRECNKSEVALFDVSEIVGMTEE